MYFFLFFLVGVEGAEDTVHQDYFIYFLAQLVWYVGNRSNW